MRRRPDYDRIAELERGLEAPSDRPVPEDGMAVSGGGGEWLAGLIPVAMLVFLAALVALAFYAPGCGELAQDRQNRAAAFHAVDVACGPDVGARFRTYAKVNDSDPLKLRATIAPRWAERCLEAP